jgi:hypothetical protein
MKKALASTSISLKGSNMTDRPPPQPPMINLMETHTYFCQYRDKYPTADAICVLIEQKTMELLQSITMVSVPIKKDQN